MNDKRKAKYTRRLMKKQYRENFVVSHINNGLAFQIRAMRDECGLSQKELARLTNTKQSHISRLEDPDYGNYNIKSLIKLASQFDVALQVRFLPFSRLLNDVCSVSPATLNVLPYSKDEDLMDCAAVPRVSSTNSYSVNSKANKFVANRSEPVGRSWEQGSGSDEKRYRILN